MTPPVPVACPSCHTVEQYVRARTLYEAGTAEIQGYADGHPTIGVVGTTPGFGWSAGAGFSATQQSLLAQRVAPPARPRWASAPFLVPLAVMWSFLVLGSPAILFVLAFDQAPTAVVGAGVAGVYGFALALTLLLLVARSRRHARELEGWARAVEKWNRLWICQRCGTTAQGEL